MYYNYKPNSLRASHGLACVLVSIARQWYNNLVNPKPFEDP